ncbi:MBL fold metallo-hydrolase [Streptomyces sp. URMC 123]|uniref:MBL fold metallo-hydrolase n=1 Tax=Streptomyces sp. URMC 123 TaxID=3423403 RepID=UPI003F1DB062
MLRGFALAAAIPALASAGAAASTMRDTAGAAGGGASRTGATFRWFGTTGWRIDFHGRTVLVDPYLTRFSTGLFEPGGTFDDKAALRTDEALVRRHIGKPELVLVSHSHWDHLNDVPYIAKSTGARIVGTETTYHLLCSMGVDAGQISVVRGGEVLDFDGCVVEVVSARHSRNARHGYFRPGTLTAPPARAPRTIADLPEGDTLAFQVTPPGGPSAFLMGASDFAERDTTGLRPDVAMIAVPGSTATHRYVPRLLGALGGPRTVVPVHWDNFETPLANPVRPDPTVSLKSFLDQVAKASPASRVVVPEYLTPYRWGG